MNIYPSAAIRQRYNEIAELCRRTGEPVFLTKKGKGDLVVLDIESWEKEKKMMTLRESLAHAEAEVARGEYYPADEVLSKIEQIIKDAEGVNSDGETA